jgi:hypothetical protein
MNIYYIMSKNYYNIRHINNKYNYLDLLLNKKVKKTTVNSRHNEPRHSEFHTKPRILAQSSG